MVYKVHVIDTACRQPVLLKVGLRVREVRLASGIPASYRTLLEVTFENVATGESVLAQATLVRPFAGVCMSVSVYVAKQW